MASHARNDPPSSLITLSPTGEEDGRGRDPGQRKGYGSSRDGCPTPERLLRGLGVGGAPGRLRYTTAGGGPPRRPLPCPTQNGWFADILQKLPLPQNKQGLRYCPGLPRSFPKRPIAQTAKTGGWQRATSLVPTRVLQGFQEPPRSGHTTRTPENPTHQPHRKGTSYSPAPSPLGFRGEARGSGPRMHDGHLEPALTSLQGLTN